jgi:hypothetical protein
MESLVSKLERDYSRRRHTWTTLARSAPPPRLEEISQDARRPQSSGEFRVLARVVELLPSAIDFYDRLLADAKKLGQEKTKLVKRLGRERAEALLIEAIKREATCPSLSNAQGPRKIPRNFFDLIEPELQQFCENREQAIAQRRRVGRKPAQ